MKGWQAYAFGYLFLLYTSLFSIKQIVQRKKLVF